MEIKEAIGRLIDRTDLNEEEMYAVMGQIMTGAATPVQIAAFLTALRMKGETVAEITAAARVMREKAHRVNARAHVVLDTCGTGGDQSRTFNISTTAAFVVAGAGVTVAKHGNRSVSSRSGSADVLAALGVKIETPKEKVEECLEKVGMGFLFAPLLHEAMKYAAVPRREMGVRTIFNLLGPLCNPAGATHQLIGLYDGGLTATIAAVLQKLGSARAMVVHSDDGLDEISLSGPTQISELSQGQVRNYTFTPEEASLKRCRLAEVSGGTPEECAAIVRQVLGGNPGPRRDIVLLNGGAALYVAGKAKSIAEGVRLAAESIDSGKAREKLEQLVAFTNR